MVIAKAIWAENYSNRLGDRLMFRASTTKNKRTREVKISHKLAGLILDLGLPKSEYLPLDLSNTPTEPGV